MSLTRRLIDFFEHIDEDMQNTIGLPFGIGGTVKMKVEALVTQAHDMAMGCINHCASSSCFFMELVF